MKKLVDDMSGFCRHSGIHNLCHESWETPSAIVVCACECHQEVVKKPAILVKKKAVKKVLTKALRS